MNQILESILERLIEAGIRVFDLSEQDRKEAEQAIQEMQGHYIFDPDGIERLAFDMVTSKPPGYDKLNDILNKVTSE